MQRESEEVKCQVPVALTSTDGCIEHKAVSFNPQTWLSAHGIEHMGKRDGKRQREFQMSWSMSESRLVQTNQGGLYLFHKIEWHDNAQSPILGHFVEKVQNLFPALHSCQCTCCGSIA